MWLPPDLASTAEDRIKTLVSLSATLTANRRMSASKTNGTTSTEAVLAVGREESHTHWTSASQMTSRAHLSSPSQRNTEPTQTQLGHLPPMACAK